MAMYILNIYNKTHKKVYSFKFKTVKEALDTIWLLPSERYYSGAVIVTKDNKYPRGERKVGEATPHKNKWTYTKWINGMESTDIHLIQNGGTLRKLTKQEYYSIL